MRRVLLVLVMMLVAVGLAAGAWQVAYARGVGYLPGAGRHPAGQDEHHQDDQNPPHDFVSSHGGDSPRPSEPARRSPCTVVCW